VQKGALDLRTSCISGVKDTAAGMPSLSMQVKLSALLLVKGRAELDQFPDARRALTNHQLDDLALAEPSSTRKSVLNMQLDCVVRLRHSGDTPLCPDSGGCSQIFLEEHCDRSTLGNLEGVR
jgi:hypothetical protein